jgi:hypothetical protein
VTQSYRETTNSQARRRNGWRRALTPAFAGLVAGPFIADRAFAAPPDALFYAAVGAKPAIYVPGGISGTYLNDAGDAGEATASASAALAASATASGGPGGSDSSIANIVYFGEVAGSLTTPIPLSIVGRLSATYGGSSVAGETSSGAGDASMAWGIEGSSYSVQNVRFDPVLGSAEACLAANPCTSVLPQVVSINSVFNVDANQIFEVAIQVDARAGDDAFASASADPIISILADFLAEHPGLSLELSANVTQPGSGGSIPEPSTWAMLLLGFTGLGFAGYRKTKTARTDFSTA